MQKWKAYYTKISKETESVATKQELERALSVIDGLTNFEKDVVINRYIQENDPKSKPESLAKTSSEDTE